MSRPIRGSGRGRAGPSDPQVIMEQRAEAQHAERIRSRYPDEWGVSAEIFELPTSSDVQATLDHRGNILAANRSDAYDLLHGRRCLTQEQHRAARRLFRDMVLASGVRLDAIVELLLDKVDGERSDPEAGELVKIDASKRANLALGGVGPVNAKLLKTINESMIAGYRRPWRAIVQQVTGETEEKTHGAIVRGACESLVLVYLAIDDQRRRADVEARGPADLRPFGEFGAAIET